MPTGSFLLKIPCKNIQILKNYLRIEKMPTGIFQKMHRYFNQKRACIYTGRLFADLIQINPSGRALLIYLDQKMHSSLIINALGLSRPWASSLFYIMFSSECMNKTFTPMELFHMLTVCAQLVPNCWCLFPIFMSSTFDVSPIQGFKLKMLGRQNEKYLF